MPQTAPNKLLMHRKASGLTQRELAQLVGYNHAAPVLRHETSRLAPALEVAFAYEIIFRVPIARLFVGLRDEVERNVEIRLAEMETALGKRSAKERNANAIAHKLSWFAARNDGSASLSHFYSE